jgi:DNA-binding beta-propeller fold protein YncE
MREFQGCKLVRLVLVAHLILLGAWRPGLAQPLTKTKRAQIKPSIVTLKPGETRRFKVIMTATRLMAATAPEKVSWSVNDVPGGSQQIGTIDETGLYRAPASVPSPCEVHIGADVPQAANRYLFATVVVGESRPEYKSIRIISEPLKRGAGSDGHLTTPHGIGLDADGNILIADEFGNSVHRYTPEGKYLGQLGDGPGEKPGQFKAPRVAIIDDAGQIYVTDSKGDQPRIQVFSRAGKFLKMFAEKGRQPGMILRAHGMDFDSQGRLYTVDVDNMRVNVYGRDGGFLYDWGVEGVFPGQFNAPHGLFVDRSDDVLITSYYGPAQKFNRQGDFIFDYCHGDPPDGPVYFHNSTGDHWGNIYICVRTKEGSQGQLARGAANKVSVLKYNNNGDFVTDLTLTTREHKESSAVVDKAGRVYALFEGEHEVGFEVFAPR